MFEGPGFPKSLDEEIFNAWLDKGRQSKIGYHYLLVVWDAYEAAYRPVYVAQRDEIGRYATGHTTAQREQLVAAYDLYSESRIL